jgi:methionyl aminopeptidase
MTEKHYGGSTSHGMRDKASNKSDNQNNLDNKSNKKRVEDKERTNSNNNYNDFIKANEIAKKVKEYVKTIVKPGVKLIDLAEKIEQKTLDLGGKPAFPCNLSINEIAAHYTPSFNDETKAHGLLKVDFGVSIDGCVSDNALSFDLENKEDNKKLIEAAELALKKATEVIKIGVTISQVGKEIEKSIKSFGFQPIQNLSGHSIEQYNLHSGVTIPNYDNSSNKETQEGVYAIEPFSTSGLGSVKDGRLSGIFKLERPGNVRDNFAREVLGFIAEEYKTLPFCSRWIYKKFGSRGLLALRQIEQQGLLHHYPQLIESGKGKVAQAEHTVIVTDKN